MPRKESPDSQEFQQEYPNVLPLGRFVLENLKTIESATSHVETAFTSQFPDSPLADRNVRNQITHQSAPDPQSTIQQARHDVHEAYPHAA